MMRSESSTEGLRGHSELTENGMPVLNAVHRVTGKLLGTVETPVTGQYGMMTHV